jgi:predicted transposase/invertase (TIGR01784 family)
MPRFRKQEEELLTHFDKWMYVLKHLSRLQEKPQWLQEKVFEKLFSEAELAKLTPEDMNRYQESLKVYRDNKNAMDYAIKIAAEAAKQEGWQEGRQEGRQEERIELARKMKTKNMAVEQIIEITGLTRAEIEKL